MATTSVAFKDPFVREYARRIQMGEVQPPAQLAGMFAGNGYFDPSQMDQLYAAINQFDPRGSAAVRSRVGDVRDADTSALGANDQLTWKSAADENDWLAPVMAIAGPVAGGYFNGAFSGLGGLEGSLSNVGGVGGLNDVMGNGFNPGSIGGEASWGVNPATGMTAAEAAILNNGAIAESLYVPSAAEISAAFPAGASVASGMGLKDALQAAGVAATVGSAIGMSGAAKDAAALQAQSADSAIAETRRQYDLNRSDNAPFLATGRNANTRLGQLLGTNPADGSVPADAKAEGGYGSLLRRFGVEDLNRDPVYQSGLQFGLDEGRRGIDSRAVATGMYDSGATLKALTRFGTDYASTKANDSYNRYNNDQSNIYGRLTGQSGAGQTAVNQNINAGNTATAQINDLTTGAGNARAAGIVGGANAWANAATGINNAANSYNNSQILERLLKSRGSSF